MNYKTLCALNELQLVQMEIAGIDDVLKDPATNEMEKYGWGLRRRVLEMGEVMLEEIVIRQMDAAPIESILPMGNVIHDTKK